MRQLERGASPVLPICVAICLAVVCGTVLLAQPHHKTHSGGDYGVPTFSNGGNYADGTRKATFNRNSPLSYHKSGALGSGTGLLVAFLVACALAAITVRNKSSNLGHGQCSQG